MGCDIYCLNREGGKEYRELNKINGASNGNLIRSFSSYPTEKQIDIFLYSISCRKDPRFEPILAKEGEKIIPNIVSRIETEKQFWNKANLVAVLIRIDSDCKCVANDSSIIKRLDQVARAPHNEANDTYLNIFKSKLESLKK